MPSISPQSLLQPGSIASGRGRGLDSTCILLRFIPGHSQLNPNSPSHKKSTQKTETKEQCNHSCQIIFRTLYKQVCFGGMPNLPLHRRCWPGICLLISTTHTRLFFSAWAALSSLIGCLRPVLDGMKYSLLKSAF